MKIKPETQKLLAIAVIFLAIGPYVPFTPFVIASVALLVAVTT